MTMKERWTQHKIYVSNIEGYNIPF
ncbi:unnamed protein product [Spirodela intermedia]|uniref:Uncharacterized protein n=2 Tax=Spirodela intermedia TaxID=51605 RepID=A0A7I8J555_SPIIN|nr:unnamed protein product [Spirodela intermedia]CAA6664511.1 unnamed protein product [Spirodela intermedia]CAA7401094.1 unnamed protein product [Spirodela intermedia]